MSGEEIYISPYYSRRERTALTYQPQTDEFLLAWYQAAAAPEADIFVQRVDEQGQPLGDPTNLTSHAAGQEKPAVAAGAGGYLAVWRDRRNESVTERDLYGQRLDLSGAPVGSLITITLASEYQSNPAVAYNQDRDEYLVVWDDNRNPGDLDIYGQIVGEDGSLSGGFGLTVSGRQAYPDVAYNPDEDSYLVVWEDDRPGTPGHDIYGQVISADGSLLGSALVIASATSNQYDPVVGYGQHSRRYLVGWWDQRNGNRDIYGQLIEGSGVLTGSNFAISTPSMGSLNDQDYPDISVGSSGQSDEFLLVWQDRRSSWNRNIYGQRVDALGNLLDEPDTSEDETDPTVNIALEANSADYDERPVVAYHDQADVYLIGWNKRDDGGVYTQRYSSAVSSTPGAGFTTTPTSGVVPLTVTVTDTSTGTIATRDWDFGDGNTLSRTSAAPVSHTYISTGAFTISLTTTNPGGSQTATTVVTVTEQITPALQVDFEDLDLGVDPTFWLDQKWDTYARDDFKTLWAGDSRALGASYTETVVYSHYAIPGWTRWQTYDYQGRLKMDHADSGIGVAFYARHPAGEPKAYVLRRDANTTQNRSFHLSAVGTGAELTGDSRLGLEPQPNVWYRFRVQSVTHPEQVTLRAKVWPEGAPEPVVWQAEAEDRDPSRLTAGAVSLRTSGPGSKYFDDLAVTPLELQADFSLPVRSGLAPFSPTFIAQPVGQVVSYTWTFGDGSPPLTSSVPTATHTYLPAGVYDVSLTVTGPQGSDSLLRPAYVQATELQTGLRGYWALDEAGGLRLDSSGSGNHLTETNSVSGAAGQVGLAADLEADDSEYLSIDDTLQQGLTITGSVTLAGWVQVESRPSRHILAAKYEYGVNNRGYRLDLGTNGDLTWIVSPDGAYSGDYSLISTGASLNLNTWYHVAAAFEAEAQTLTIYVDGVRVANRSVAYDQVYPSTAPFMLGANLQNGAVVQHFDGLLDEWRVYGRALSESEIEALMTINPPTVNFSGFPQSGPPPLNVTFSNSTMDAAVYLWNFGDGITATLAAPSHTYTQSGVYTVALTASGAGGSAILTRTHYITVTPGLVAGFSAFPLSGPAPLLVQFLDNSSGAESYLWTFGDTMTSTQASPTHTYTAPGVYTVTQTVSSSGESHSLTQTGYIAVSPPLTLDFGATPLSGSAPLTVTFVNSTTGASSYLWRFGDGITSTQTSPSHSYTQTGVYDVSLTAGNGQVTETLTHTDYITITSPVLASFAPFPPTVEVGETVLFLNSSSGATGYLWDFGDTITSTQTSPSHTYSLPGVYSVSLTAESGLLTDTVSQPLTVTLLSTATLRGHWSLEEASGTRADQSVKHNHLTPYNGVGSAPGQVGQGADFELDNAQYLAIDDAVQNGLAITGSLTLAGWLKAESLGGASGYRLLAAKYDYGLSERAFRFDSREGGAKLGFIVSPDGTFDSSKLLAASVPGGLSPGVWYHVAAVFEAGEQSLRVYLNGDEIGSRTVSYSSIHDSSAPFMLGANLKTGGGGVIQHFDGVLDEWRVYASALTERQIEVLMDTTPFTVDFSAAVRQGPVPLEITFSNAGAGAASYQWDFGDGATSTVISPTHTYEQVGVYTVSLSATGLHGTQIVTKTNYITATAPPDGVITPGGGVITTAEGTVTLEFAPGAVTETLAVYVTTTDLVQTRTLTTTGEVLDPYPMGGLPYLVYDFEAERTDGTVLNHVEFQAPVTLTIAYQPEDVQGLVEETLTYIHYDHDTQQAEVIPTVVQSDTDHLVAPLAHFSTGGVAGQNALWFVPAQDAFSVALAKGSAGYSYDLPLPSGPGGFGPNLTLAYNSGGLNGLVGERVSSNTGWVGPGWSLELGQIASRVVGRKDGNPLLEYNLTLNGVSERLITLDQGQTYQTLHQTFMRITDGSGEGNWIVTDTDGTTYTFGDANRAGTILTYAGSGSGPGACENVQQTFKLYQVEDVHGNVMTIDYNSFTGISECQEGSEDHNPTPQSYVKQINYTTNTGAGDSLAEYEIEFVISPKANGAPYGIRGDVGKKLDDIKIWDKTTGATTPARHIHFKYKEVEALDEHQRAYTVYLLEQIQHLDVDLNTADSVPPPTTFSYQDHPVRSTWLEREGCKPEDGGETPPGPCPKVQVWDRPFLTQIDNGYGGQIGFEYEAFPPETPNNPNDLELLFQVVKRRAITDTVTNQASFEDYVYLRPKIVADNHDEYKPGVEEYGHVNFNRF